MKEIFIVIAFMIGMSSGITNVRSAESYKLYISQVDEHIALDRTRLGILDALRRYGIIYGQNLELRYESAQGNPDIAQQIATKFVNHKPDLVIGIGTLSAQSFIKYASDRRVKLIFSSITDPFGASLLKDAKNPITNTTGVSNFIDLEPQLKVFKEILPTMKTIGVLYNPGEANSISIVQMLEKICPKLDLILVTQTINKTADVAQNTASLITKADAIFISNDNTALSALSKITKIATKAKIPVFISDTDAIDLGALVALGPDQYEIGR